MKKVLQSYKATLILVGAIIVGGGVGFLLGEDAKVLAPLGDLFINLLFVIIVPLIFLTITTSIAKMTEPKRVSRIMKSVVVVFLVTSLVAVLVGIVSICSLSLVDTQNGEEIRNSLTVEEKEEEELELDLLDRTVQVLSVDDFSKLLSKDHVVAILIFAILFGLAIKRAGKSGEATLKILISLNEVVLKLVDLIMYYAPIGLGCYFAVMVGTFGASIATSYLRVFVIYLVVSVLFYFVVYTIYAYVAGGMEGVKAFWKNVLPSTLTSLATCSSAACIPVNIDTTKKIGVSDDIAETVIPMGTSFHKDGSIIGSVFKIMFLVCLFGGDIGSVGVGKVIGIALLANLLVTAVPIGGGTISETLIISMLGYPMAALPILTIIATIIDAPATMLNVVGDTSSSMLVARIVDGKNWRNQRKG